MDPNMDPTEQNSASNNQSALPDTSTAGMADNTSAQADVQGPLSNDWDILEVAQNFLAQVMRRHEQGKEANAEEMREQAIKMLKRPAPALTTLSPLQLMDGYWDYIANRKEAAPTGMPQLDALLNGGLDAQTLTVLLGAPGGGKTTFANQIATQIADAGHP